jgi:hypothetical protein
LDSKAGIQFDAIRADMPLTRRAGGLRCGGPAMRKRFISFMLALLYLSVSIAFSAPHSHEHGKALPDQCVACAWHLESNADVSTGPVLISVPLLTVIHTPAPDVQTACSTPRLQSDRGPPVHS